LPAICLLRKQAVAHNIQAGAFILIAMLLRPEVNSVLATQAFMKARQWQLIFLYAPAICLLRKQAVAHNIQAGAFILI